MKIALKITIFLLFFLHFGKLYSETKVAYIDLDFVLNNSKIGKELSQKLEKKLATNNKKNEKIEKELKEEEKKIISQKNILKKEEYEKLLRSYDEEVKKFNNIRKKRNEDFNKFRINSQKKILETLNPIITTFLKKESVQILLQKEQIIFGDNKLDITEEILNIFNDKHKKIKFD